MSHQLVKTLLSQFLLYLENNGIILCRIEIGEEPIPLSCKEAFDLKDSFSNKF